MTFDCFVDYLCIDSFEVFYINVEPWSSQDITDRQIMYVCIYVCMYVCRYVCYKINITL